MLIFKNATFCIVHSCVENCAIVSNAVQLQKIDLKDMCMKSV